MYRVVIIDLSRDHLNITSNCDDADNIFQKANNWQKYYFQSLFEITRTWLWQFFDNSSITSIINFGQDATIENLIISINKYIYYLLHRQW